MEKKRLKMGGKYVWDQGFWLLADEAWNGKFLILN